jgi:TPR repeat protein
MYFYGNQSLEQDTQVAAEWYAEAAERGHAKSQYKLGKMLVEGDGSMKDQVIG